MSTTHLVILPNKWIKCRLWWMSFMVVLSCTVMYTKIYLNHWQGVEKGWSKEPDIGCCFVIDSSSPSQTSTSKACSSLDPWCLASYLTHSTYIPAEWMNEWVKCTEQWSETRSAMWGGPTLTTRIQLQTQISGRRVREPGISLNDTTTESWGSTCPTPDFYLYCKTHYSTV